MPSEREKQAQVPWAQLATNLEKWLVTLNEALRDGNVREVVVLMEGFVQFIASNQGKFLRSLMTDSDVKDALRQQGAPEEFITVFTAVLQVVASQRQTRVITFGPASSLNANQLAQLRHSFRGALPPSPGDSPRVRSPSPSGRLLSSPSSPSSTSRPAVTQNAPSTEELGLIQRSDGTLEAINAIELSRMTNAVGIKPEMLPPEVVQGLSEMKAVPFIFFQWLSSCYVEVLLCVQYGDTTYVLKRKIQYVGPKPETQLEGPVCLPSNEKVMLCGPVSLPWMDVPALLDRAGSWSAENNSEA